MKDIPKVYVNKINKINNNKEVYYSIYDDYIEEKVNIKDVRNKIEKLFRSNDFVYKKKLHIKTINEENDYIIVSKSIDYLLTIEGMRIMINDIIEIY